MAGFLLACGCDHEGTCSNVGAGAANAWGTLRGPYGDVSFERGWLSGSHAQDADAGEGGCVTGLSIRVRDGDDGCELGLGFSAGEGPGLELISAVWWLDNRCAGVPAGEDASWEWTGEGAARVVVPPVPRPDASFYCYGAQLEPDGVITLEEPGREPFELDLGGLGVSGRLETVGTGSGGCPGS